jgi:hypothetical protein
MGYPIKTSDKVWLTKAHELYNKRISITIIDDADYNLDINSDSIESFKRFSLRYTQIVFLSLFYFLSFICGGLFIVSFSLHYAKPLGLLFSILGIFICFGIPTYLLRKNRPPKIIKTNSGIDIIFNDSKKEILDIDNSQKK